MMDSNTKSYCDLGNEHKNDRKKRNMNETKFFEFKNCIKIFYKNKIC